MPANSRLEEQVGHYEKTAAPAKLTVQQRLVQDRAIFRARQAHASFAQARQVVDLAALIAGGWRCTAGPASRARCVESTMGTPEPLVGLLADGHARPATIRSRLVAFCYTT